MHPNFYSNKVYIYGKAKFQTKSSDRKTCLPKLGTFHDSQVSQAADDWQCPAELRPVPPLHHQRTGSPSSAKGSVAQDLLRLIRRADLLWEKNIIFISEK